MPLLPLVPLLALELSTARAGVDRAGVDRAALDAAFAAAKLDAPSVVAVVMKDGKTVWERRKNAAPDRPFRVGSLTKAFTAVVLLQLRDEGRLSLDDPASRFVPGLPAAWRAVTVRRLLNHTGGIPDYTSMPDFETRMGERLTPEAIVGRTADKPLDSPPGTGFAYSNSGYVILGMIAERLDRRPFADSLRDRVFRPLGLRHTRLNVGGKAEVLGFGEGGKPAAAIDMSQPYAAGSVVSTIGDMARWVGAQDSPRLLRPSSWAEIEMSGALADGTPVNYGFGWALGAMNDVPTIEHSGGIPGFTAIVVRVPSRRLAAIVLANSDAVKPTVVARDLLRTADPSLRGPVREGYGPTPKTNPVAPENAPSRS